MRHLIRGVLVLILLGIVGLTVAIVAIALPFPTMPSSTRAIVTVTTPAKNVAALDGRRSATSVPSERSLVWI